MWSTRRILTHINGRMAAHIKTLESRRDKAKKMYETSKDPSWQQHMGELNFTIEELKKFQGLVQAYKDI